MAWQERTYHLKSVCPMLHHNGQTVDPTNKYAKLMKQITSKRAKTDADYDELARIEFMASIYVNKDGPVLPAQNVAAMLIEASKKNREGKLAKAGMYCSHHAKLLYDGPRDVDEMWLDGRFRSSERVRIGTSRVVRTRAIFEEWEARVTIAYEDSIVNPSQVDEWMGIASTQVGFGDWRPQYGRFEITSIE